MNVQRPWLVPRSPSQHTGHRFGSPSWEPLPRGQKIEGNIACESNRANHGLLDFFVDFSVMCMNVGNWLCKQLAANKGKQGKRRLCVISITP